MAMAGCHCKQKNMEEHIMSMKENIKKIKASHNTIDDWVVNDDIVDHEYIRLEIELPNGDMATVYANITDVDIIKED